MQLSNSSHESIPRKFAKVLAGARHLQDPEVDKGVQPQSLVGHTRGAQSSCDPEKVQRSSKGTLVLSRKQSLWREVGQGRLSGGGGAGLGL